jgi:aryl-alcohol dehydrogenase-like predicted oxidoreductase/HEAT repeat protein
MHARTRLLSRSPDVRLAALSDLDPHCAADVYAARAALLSDEDGRVRAEAAQVLTKSDTVNPVPWLHDATYDDRPSVREAAARALGLCPHDLSPRAQHRLSHLARLDPIWWVRRTAALSLARLGHGEAIGTIKQVLGDPFWRVRHAAIRALETLWHALPNEREQILTVTPGMSEAAQGAQLELQARVEPSLASYKAEAPRPTDQALANPDPAVTTARLRARPLSELTPAELLPFLSDPHTQLRELAVDRLARLSRATELEEVLPFLQIPGLPHALESTWELLSKTGRRAMALTTRILSDAESPVGAVMWACHKLLHSGGRRNPVRAALEHPHPLARHAAVRCLDELGETDTTLFDKRLDDDDAEVRAAALHALVTRVKESELGRLLPLLFGPDVRPLTQLALLERALSGGDLPLIHRLLDEEHPLVRARALRALLTLGRLSDVTRYEADEDPLIRQAIVPALATETLIHWLAHDPDPQTRREVLRQLWRRRRQLTTTQRGQVLETASCDEDPWQRTRASSFASPTEHLPILLQLSRDRHLSVRHAATTAIAEHPDLDTSLRALLATGQLSSEQRLAAYSEQLKRAMDDEASLRALRHELQQAENPNEATSLVSAIATLLGEAQPPSQLHSTLRTEQSATREQPQPSAPRRRLGQTDLFVSPLALSGVHELSPRAYDRAIDAGVNLFFWEPGYQTLTRVIRTQRRKLHIITGSYEGDGDSITADVERALRRLQTDCLDVFLLFWVRSPERLNDEVRQTLAQLKVDGKIRAAGFSTHDRSLAQAAISDGGIDVLMTRHSAAHRGAEQSLFPQCEQAGVGLLTFSATSYGRLLRAIPGQPAPLVRPTAADCYRYSLAQRGVTAVISAPSYPSELDDNLTVMHDLTLPETRRAQLIRHGDDVHAMSRRFNALVRKGHESPLHAPNEPTTISQRLAELLAEHPAPPSESITAASTRRHAKAGPERRS